jgi:hypothetical protein
MTKIQKTHGIGKDYTTRLSWVGIVLINSFSGGCGRATT